MVKLIFWGDSHIPYRADKLPEDFIEFLKKEKPEIMVVTGDLVIYEVLEPIESLAKKVYAVRGNMDEGKAAKKFPIIEDFEISGTKISVFHGHGIYPRGDPLQLCQIARKRNSRILITGHTHMPFVGEYSRIIILNPGSVCGVWGGGGGYGYPTWGELCIDEKVLRVRIFELRAGMVSIYGQKNFQL